MSKDGSWNASSEHYLWEADSRGSSPAIPLLQPGEPWDSSSFDLPGVPESQLTCAPLPSATPRTLEVPAGSAVHGASLAAEALALHARTLQRQGCRAQHDTLSDSSNVKFWEACAPQPPAAAPTAPPTAAPLVGGEAKMELVIDLSSTLRCAAVGPSPPPAMLLASTCPRAPPEWPRLPRPYSSQDGDRLPEARRQWQHPYAPARVAATPDRASHAHQPAPERAAAP